MPVILFEFGAGDGFGEEPPLQTVDVAMGDEGHIGWRLNSLDQHWGAIAIRHGQDRIKYTIATLLIDGHSYQTAVYLDQFKTEFV